MIRQQQRGVALISVLLVFALVALLASQIMNRSFVDLKKTANTINSKQAYFYALGAEAYARQLLFRDFQQQNKPADHLKENWAQQRLSLDIAEGELSIEITDLHSKFNLNNMLTINGQINTTAANQFKRLLLSLAINKNYTNVLRDWLDRDKQLMPSGAEDSEYLAASSAYLPANAKMADRSELRLLHTMTADDYQLLQQYLVALPQATLYNLNTIDQVLLKSITADLTDSQIDAIVKRQQQEGYHTLAEWIQQEGQPLFGWQSQFGVSSDHFEVKIKAVYADRISVLRTYLYRDPDSGEMTVIKRLTSKE